MAQRLPPRYISVLSQIVRALVFVAVIAIGTGCVALAYFIYRDM